MERLPSRTSALLASRATKTRRWRGTRHGPPRRGIAAGTDARWNWAASPPRNYFIVSPGIPTGTSPRGGPRPVPRCATGRGLEGRGALGCAVYARCAGRNNAYTRRCVSGNVSRSQRASRGTRGADWRFVSDRFDTALSVPPSSGPPTKAPRAIRPNRFSIRHKARPCIRWLSLRTPSDRIQTRSSIQRDSMRDLCVAETRTVRVRDRAVRGPRLA